MQYGVPQGSYLGHCYFLSSYLTILIEINFISQHCLKTHNQFDYNNNLNTKVYAVTAVLSFHYQDPLDIERLTIQPSIQYHLLYVLTKSTLIVCMVFIS